MKNLVERITKGITETNLHQFEENKAVSTSVVDGVEYQVTYEIKKEIDLSKDTDTDTENWCNWENPLEIYNTETQDYLILN